jgi:hypothetical protein
MAQCTRLLTLFTGTANKVYECDSNPPFLTLIYFLISQVMYYIFLKIYYSGLYTVIR